MMSSHWRRTDTAVSWSISSQWDAHVSGHCFPLGFVTASSWGSSVATTAVQKWNSTAVHHHFDDNVWLWLLHRHSTCFQWWLALCVCKCSLFLRQVTLPPPFIMVYLRSRIKYQRLRKWHTQMKKCKLKKLNKQIKTYSKHSHHTTVPNFHANKIMHMWHF